MAFTPPSSLEPATVTVAGTVAVSNFPATQPVSGTVAVSNFPATQPVSGSVSVSNFPATQPVSGTVSVGNFPATQPVSGTVSVGNFPATQPVSGTVAATQGTSPWVTDGSAVTQPVSVASLPLPDGAATEETTLRSAESLDDVGLTAILEREKIPA